jgi:hypothetical protein
VSPVGGVDKLWHKILFLIIWMQLEWTLEWMRKPCVINKIMDYHFLEREGILMAAVQNTLILQIFWRRVHGELNTDFLSMLQKSSEMEAGRSGTVPGTHLSPVSP